MAEKQKGNYASVERADPQQVEKDARIFRENEILNKIADAVSSMLVILNSQRQIIYSNKLFLDFLNLTDSVEVIGKRVGEAVDCIHSFQQVGGCGTSEFCRTCGSVGAFLESQQGKKSVKECRIITCRNDALDLRVTATPYDTNGVSYTIFAIHDISHEKRREILERVFFHDVLNSAGGISGLSSILEEINDPEDIQDVAKTIKHAAKNMIEEIQAQRHLSAAETGDLKPDFGYIGSLSLLKETASLFSKHKITGDKSIVIDEHAADITVYSDSVILRRILGNMLKNALEASRPKSTVTISCRENDTSVRFSVHNNSFIERDIQLQLFNRSFSTKGAGRGIGTYSMKLLGEKYLKGTVWFESSHETGTHFFIEVPKR